MVPRTAFLLATCLAIPTCVVHAQTPGEPSWKTGKSAWNGSGYDSLPSPTAPLAAPIRPTSTPELSPWAPGALPPQRPYTIPTTPGVHSNPYLATSVTASQLPQAGFSELNLTDSNGVDSISLTSNGPPRAGVGLPNHGSTPNADAPDTLTAPKNFIGELPAPITKKPAPEEAAPNDNDTTTAPSTMGDKIATSISIAETAPLESEVIRWYQYPLRWMRGWDSNAEFGLDGSNGNADTLALQTGLELKRKTDRYTFAIDIDYRLANSKSVTTEDNGRFNLDVDRLLSDSPWSTFGKFGVEWDKFKAFDLRLNLNGGVGYHWIREDNTTLVTRFGAGASKEIDSPDEDWIAEAVFGMEAERQLNSRHKVKAKLDYFPAWEDFSNYRLVADASWEILLDDEDNFSLKLAATDRYDSTPQGAKANDVYYSLLLLYKF